MTKDQTKLKQRLVRGLVGGITAALVLVFFTVVLPELRRPNKSTRDAYDAVRSALMSGEPFSSVPEQHRTRFLEASEWTADDVARMDRADEMLRGALAAFARALPPDAAVGSTLGAESSPEQARYMRINAALMNAARHLERWDADGAKKALALAEKASAPSSQE